VTNSRIWSYSDILKPLSGGVEEVKVQNERLVRKGRKKSQISIKKNLWTGGARKKCGVGEDGSKSPKVVEGRKLERSRSDCVRTPTTGKGRKGVEKDLCIKSGPKNREGEPEGHTQHRENCRLEKKAER